MATTKYEETCGEMESEGESDVARKGESADGSQEEVLQRPIAHPEDVRKVLTLQEELERINDREEKEWERIKKFAEGKNR